ncbi:(2Fe-2S)-binding protein [Afifella marina]|uniref:2Fe-2S iron-sulfur cluster binding domain-containing protein n=1 Tax=Afifella marina DSM 2698 TaxID=1120955 RepID=A0A1G5NRD1_AFIMA|nr:(2Fe-2S)-binding protein [Afifella marina]MBK1624718.1 sarcosine oxidase [Afifella marina DSM 2698]MBK1628530.1 sarcosine oxidase [Afifella marina]MBK5915889.1 sarcosine oxidase [Afifella marina]RAI20572.1 sarcosine oxidase [Afifella marina DSM 2698]SCZ39714.1 2Fe-2S iron-sulfur cluster binding domain-containing protein [Afifella marina DSM 2698]
MFKRAEETGAPALSFTFEGKPLKARSGDTIAAALLAADERIFRTTPVTETPRGPFCLMGVCFDCLVEIDGVPNRQACMVQVEEGMQVRRQSGSAEVIS